MMKTVFLAVMFCLLASASQVSAQLVIRNNGHAEIGVNPNVNDNDTATVLKIFGNGTTNASGGHVTFGDSTFVSIGELGGSDSNRLWMHGKNGLYLTATTSSAPTDVVCYFDTDSSYQFHFNYDVTACGMFVPSDERFKENVEPVK